MGVITIEWLEEKRACTEAKDLFKEELGEEANIEDVLRFVRRHEKSDWEAWLLTRDPELTKLLLEKGANVHARNDYALRRAAENEHLEVVELLIGKGADIHAYDDYALRWAAENGHLEVVELLEKYK